MAVFNSLQPAELWTDRPASLPPGGNFFLTDRDVILAFLLLTAELHRFDSYMLTDDRHYMELDRKSIAAGPLRGHLGSPQRTMVPDLTREELGKIVKEGYPPFYRARFKTSFGFELDSPITNVDDIRRPAWVVSLGLGTVQPTALYIDKEDASKGGMFNTAVNRVYEVLDKGFLPRWGWKGQDIHSQIQHIKDMIQGSAASDTNPYVGVDELRPGQIIAYPDPARNPALMPSLAEEVCKTLLRVVNVRPGEGWHITAEDHATLEPHLIACLLRVKLGVWVALRYGAQDRKVVVPREWGYHREIWLHGC
jgi:hypothetical protein